MGPTPFYLFIFKFMAVLLKSMLVQFGPLFLAMMAL